MRRYLPFLIPFVVIVSAGLGARLWFLATAEGPCDAPVKVAWSDLDVDRHCVRVKGLAHYPAVIRQKTAGNPFRDEATFYVFPLFDVHDTKSRGVRVLVRTTRRPERLVSYEYMTVEGRIGPVTPDKVPFASEVSLGKKSDYFFEEGILLLEPYRIESDDEVWTVND